VDDVKVYRNVTARAGVGLWPLTSWDFGFEFRLGHGCLSVVLAVCCAGRRVCTGLITRPKELYRLWCVWVWSWSLSNEDALAVAPWKKKTNKQTHKLLAQGAYQ